MGHHLPGGVTHPGRRVIPFAGGKDVMAKPTFKRVDEDTYSVHVAGERIGEVYRSWARLGGWGWGWSDQDVHLVRKTRREAANELISQGAPKTLIQLAKEGKL